MIAPLRRRHRLMITFLALTVPALVVLAISQRPGRDLQRLGAPPPPPTLPAHQEITELFTQPPTSGRLWQEGAQAILHVRSTAAPRLPDLLLYWSPTPPAAGLPADAVLLAPLPSQGDRVMPLPRATAGGYLLLYSLAHQTVAEKTELPLLDAPAASDDAEEESAEDVDAQPTSDLPEPTS